MTKKGTLMDLFSVIHAQVSLTNILPINKNALCLHKKLTKSIFTVCFSLLEVVISIVPPFDY